MSILRSTLKAVAAAAFTFVAASSAQASVYQIQFSGLNLNYDQTTGYICDSGGGLGCNAAADPLFTMTFIRDGLLQGFLASDVAANIAILLAPGTDPGVGATHNLIGSPFDVYDLELSGVAGLFTDIASGQVSFSNGALNVTGTGFSTVVDQALPFGFVGSDPINWSFSTGIGSCSGATGSQVCTYAGTGELSWSEVPEPGSLALLGLGLAGLAAVSRRKQKQG